MSSREDGKEVYQMADIIETIKGGDEMASAFDSKLIVALIYELAKKCHSIEEFCAILARYTTSQ
jgi:hypothetical protein